MFRFQQCRPKRGVIDGDDSEALFLIRCAHEIQDARVMQLLASFAYDENDEEGKTFRLEDIDIAPVESTALFQFLSCIKNLQKLEINNCRMEDVVIRELVTKLLTENSGNSKITELNITNSGLKDEGAKYLSDALKSDNCKLIELDIWGNKLKDDGAKYLSDALKSDNCKLIKLDIWRNELKNEGAKYLSDALRVTTANLLNWA